MSENKRQIRLGAFLMETGHHIAAWRHPDTHASGGLDFAHYAHYAHYAQVAQIAERAKFDTIFFADSVSVRDTNLASLSRTARCRSLRTVNVTPGAFRGDEKYRADRDGLDHLQRAI